MNGISITIEDKVTLYKMYMPHIIQGGLFIPTKNAYALGDHICVNLKLFLHPEMIQLMGKVVWITPENAQGNRPQGVGLQFSGKETPALKPLIEKGLGDLLESQDQTFTF